MANVWDAMRKRRAEQDQQESLEEIVPDSALEQDELVPSPQKAPKRRKVEAEKQPVGFEGYSELLRAHHDRGGSVTEEYRSLRTNLLAQSPDERFCYVVTSADPGEGKTVTCGNLSIVMAERTDRRTVLVDFDLRRGRVAQLFGCEKSPGVAEMLTGKASLEECLQPTGHSNLFLLPCGTVSHASVGELVGKPELEDVVHSLRQRFDYVIFDTPPINIASDAGIIGAVAGDALVVVRMGKTRQESAETCIRLLHSANVRVGGLVLTHRKFHVPDYLYRYA